MQIQVILNRVYRLPGFVYKRVEFGPGPKVSLEVTIDHRRNSRPRCSVCDRKGSQYDRQREPRRFQFIGFWGIAVWFLYAPRRASCKTCQRVKIEKMPWGNGKSSLTWVMQWFLAAWARRLSCQETATVFGVIWKSVASSVRMAVEWGRKRVRHRGVKSIGVDEIYVGRRNKFLTLVYQIDAHRRRLLWIGDGKSKETLQGFFDWFGESRSRRLKYICSDMAGSFLSTIRGLGLSAVLVLDRFHVVKLMKQGIDEVRREEVKEQVRQGNDVLKNSRWCLLKSKDKLTKPQMAKLRELSACNLHTMKAYLLTERFQEFWTFRDLEDASTFMHEWFRQARRSRIAPFKRIANTLDENGTELLSWIEAEGQISNGAVEGLNSKAKLVNRRSYGFRSKNSQKIALYHNLAQLPEPNFTHRFW